MVGFVIQKYLKRYIRAANMGGVVMVFILLLCEAGMRVCLEFWAHVRSPVFKSNELIQEQLQDVQRSSELKLGLFSSALGQGTIVSVMYLEKGLKKREILRKCFIQEKVSNLQGSLQQNFWNSLLVESVTMQICAFNIRVLFRKLSVRYS